ncbi:MAG: radical SAM protein [Thermodesulfobacteriota bacterium]
MPSVIPSYIETHRKGLLKEKKEAAYRILEACTLCPRECRVNRRKGDLGICKTADSAIVSSYAPHFGEESPLVGRHGSGTIFLTHCNLMCTFCQNYEISHEGEGSPVSHEELAAMMICLQEMGCHNINFVTPTHVVPQILGALEKAVEQGLSIPLVYNSGGYDRVSTLSLLEGVFDIYMPDFKFWDSEIAEKTCQAPDYPQVAREALMEMHRQAGDLVIDNQGIASRGLLIRHLVLPHELAGTRKIMRFIASRISKNSYVNIMPQYRPCGKAWEIQKLARPLTGPEYEKSLEDAAAEGIKRLDQRRRTFITW